MRIISARSASILALAAMTWYSKHPSMQDKAKLRDRLLSMTEDKWTRQVIRDLFKSRRLKASKALLIWVDSLHTVHAPSKRR